MTGTVKDVVMLDEAAQTVARIRETDDARRMATGWYRLITAGHAVNDPAGWRGAWATWPPARDAWRAVRDREAVNLIYLATCGCTSRARRHPENLTRHGWRRLGTCAAHSRRPRAAGPVDP